MNTDTERARRVDSLLAENIRLRERLRHERAWKWTWALAWGLSFALAFTSAGGWW